MLFISLFEFKSVFNIHTSFVFKENTYGHTKANWWRLSHQRKIMASVTPKHGATWRPNKSHGDCHIKTKKSLKIPKGVDTSDGWLLVINAIIHSVVQRSLKIPKGGNQNPYIQEEQTTQWPKEKVQKDKQWSTKHTHKTKDWVTRIPLKTNHDKGHTKTIHEEHVV